MLDGLPVGLPEGKAECTVTTVAALKTLEDTDAGNAAEESCVES